MPMSLGARPAMSGGFTLLSFGDIGVADMVYVEHPVGPVGLIDCRHAALVLSHAESRSMVAFLR
jgi:hypothetical protein